MNKPTMLQRIFGRITEYFVSTANAMNGRVRIYTRRWRSQFAPPANDWSRADYPYWRNLYYGHVVGLQISGLLVKPVVRKVCQWTLGRAPGWKCDNKTSERALNDWWNVHHFEILQAWTSALKQGDAVVVINSDLSITLVWPDFLDPIVAEDDFGNVIGWRITQTLDHPDDLRKMRVIDEYYLDRRVHIVEVNAVPTSTETFPNLIGRIPLVVVTNHRDDGGIFGHPECEGMIPLLQSYGDVIQAAIEGNVLQGRPTPVVSFANANAQADFLDTYGTNVPAYDELGNPVTERVLDIDITKVVTIVEGEFEYKSPGSFSVDVAAILQLLYYLYLEHAEIPEFVLGSAIESSKASAETQMPVFEKFIELFQSEMTGWLTEIAQIVLAYQSVITPGVGADEPQLQWLKVTQEGRLTLDTLVWAYEQGLIDRATALMLAPIEVFDMEAVLAKAEAEKQARMVEQQKVFAAQQNARFAAQGGNGGEEEDSPRRGPRSASRAEGAEEMVPSEVEAALLEATAILEAAG